MRRGRQLVQREGLPSSFLQCLELPGRRRVQVQRAEKCLFMPDRGEGQLDRRNVSYQRCELPGRRVAAAPRVTSTVTWGWNRGAS